MNSDHLDEIARLRIELCHAKQRIAGLERPVRKPMNKTTREALILFAVQIVSFCILCINFRAIAQAHYHTAAVSDFFIASIQFFIIKRIANSDDSMQHWVGYTLGSVVGSYLGIYISTIL